jgi:myo-inositol-1(or 4)-monophosphatase
MSNLAYPLYANYAIICSLVTFLSACMQPLLNIAVSAARNAGDIIVRHMEQIDRLNITLKNSNEYFSEVDVKAEQAIIQTIHKAYPEHGIIAEESGVHAPDAESVWIIDPLDGTTNYLHGYPFFCVSIALKVKNRIEHGVVYDPLRHECFHASRGRGARLNDRRLRVSKQTLLAHALLGTGLRIQNPNISTRYISSLQSLIGKCASVRKTGSAALDLAYLAAGRLDGFWEFGLRPWDIAAGTLLITEAGGLVSDMQGGESYLQQGDLVAGTPKVFKALLQTLNAENAS